MVTMLSTNVTSKICIKHTRILKFAIIGTILVCMASFILIINPLELIVQDQLSIREGSLLFSLFKEPPLEVFISVYIFNITNLDAFLREDDPKLKLDEVGPYVYQEFLVHENYTYHKNGTLSYFPKRTVVFVPERSVGDPKIDIVTVPNIPFLGASAAAAKMNIFAEIALMGVAKTVNARPVLNLTVHDYLWGYEDRLVSIGATFIPEVITFESFGLLDRMFDEGINEVTVNLPEILKNNNEIINRETIRNDDDRNLYQEPIRDYSIDSWNGNQGLHYWGYDDENRNSSTNTLCNTLHGAYDGTLFPQNISKNEEFRVYRKAFCRTLTIKFDHADELNGLEAYYFELAENAFDSEMDDPNSSCFCMDKCLKKGLGNITPCYYNIPAAVSYPHFYRSDPSLLDGIEGLSPNASKHSSEIVLQPQMGVPMRVHSRIQINILLDDIGLHSETKPFRDLVLPIFWMEIAIEGLTPELNLLMNLLFNVLPYLQASFICLLCIVGVILYTIAALSYFWASYKITELDDNGGNGCGGGGGGRGGNVGNNVEYDDDDFDDEDIIKNCCSVALHASVMSSVKNNNNNKMTRAAKSTTNIKNISTIYWFPKFGKDEKTLKQLNDKYENV